jgi:hypothetical protein
VVTRAGRGGWELGQPSLGYWGCVECRTLSRVLSGWSPTWSVVRAILGDGGWWYLVAGGKCCRERNCAWAVKPGAPHVKKLLLHCLLTRSGIIGLAGVGWLLCTGGVRERVLASRGSLGQHTLTNRVAAIHVYNNASLEREIIEMSIIVKY